jgi:hypothetical protein
LSNCPASNDNPHEPPIKNLLNPYLEEGGREREREIAILKVLVLYFMTCVDFLSNRQSLKNKKHNLVFIEKSEKPYILTKY